MTAKQKILTGGTVLVLTGLPVYQQTRINTLSEQVATLTETNGREKRAATPVMAAVSGETGPRGRSPGPAADKDSAAKKPSHSPGGTVSKVAVPGPGEATFGRRGDSVVLESFRSAPPASGSSSGEAALPALAGGLEGLPQRSPQVSGHVNWDHAQATGAPDTNEPGDRPTAWAPRSPRSGEQWLKLGYDKAVEVKEINVHESYNSGAISKVTAFLPNGSEKTLWTGNAAKGSANEIQETSIPVPAGITSNQIKIYVDTNRVESWPEIDAVQLVARNGSKQWATSSSASSSYSELYSAQGSGAAPSSGTVLDLGAGEGEAILRTR
ncbi:MAG TPA: hypothetical protein VG796_24990 [Verrucomicrobiales bacterium]|nr:hypothetical protein [Verrucomicrobiales bacterium]